ncbi:uncharacterized protein LOC133533926 isoform X2 [Cydia pomonella]|uniref:uncharacterized protein LOC133533926 isoform X2 n=1 Tax=Cydia pomonella TaxID=82600 RepID=UPI002ADE3264|nr:uncharacterized protein LOC133533926 isoform X2 [Cydia pomonella]
MILSLTGVLLIGVFNFLYQTQSPITISDDDSEANAVLLPCDCEQQTAAANVHEQTTLKLDTPDYTQAQLDQSPDHTLESSTRNLNGHPHVTGNSPQNQSENLIPDYSPRNFLQDGSSSSLNGSGNQEFERRPKRQNLSSIHIPRCQSSYIIPTSSSRILETLHPGSNKSARNQSKNAAAESSPMGRNENSQADSRQISSNRSDVQMPEQSTKIPNEMSENPNEQSQSSEEPNQTKQTRGNQELEHIRKKHESDKENAEQCQCKCPCNEQKIYLGPGHFPAESVSISENNEEVICEECQCTCTCETNTCDKSTGSDSQLNYTRSEHFMKNTLTRSENDEKLNIQESQRICRCKELKQTPGECTSICPCKGIQSCEQSKVTPSQVEDTHLMQESNMSCKRHVRFCPVDETRLCDTFTSSDSNRWFITAEGIMRGLAALRQTFIGKSEDYTSVWINKTAENQPSTSNNENYFPTINPSGSNIHLHNLKKSVSILRRNRIRCDYCNRIEGSQEDETGGHHQRDQEVQRPERADRSQSDEMFEVEDAAPIPGSSTMRDTLEVAERSSETLNDARRIGMNLQGNELAQVNHSINSYLLIYSIF